MISSANLRTILLCVAVALGAPAAAQSTLPGGHDSGASQQRAMYESAMRAKADSLMTRWENAFLAHDALALARFYEPDATITFSTGGRLSGREAIRGAFERLFPRMRAPHVTIGDFVRGSGTASVHGTVSFEVNNGDGWYAHSTPIAFVLRTDSWERYLIQEQEGGDVVSLIALSHPPAYLSTLEPQIVKVRLLDATGDGVRDAPVIFSIRGRRGEIAPGSTRTDAQGFATATFAPSSLRETDTVSVLATILPDERMDFRFRVLENSAVKAARELLLTMGTPAQLDSLLSATIDERRKATPRPPAEFWDGVSRDSIIDAALDSLALLYAERLSPETVRAMDSVYRSPAGREFVGARTALFGEAQAAEGQWRAMLDAWIKARLRADAASGKQ